MPKKAKARPEKIAEALRRTKSASGDGIVRSSDLSKSDLLLLKESGWLHEILAGWHVLVRPGHQPGDTVPPRQARYDHGSNARSRDAMRTRLGKPILTGRRCWESFKTSVNG